MVYKYEVWKINKIQLLKMSSKLLDSMTGTLRCDYNDNNIIMIRIITVRIIPIATISSLLSILQTLACSLISMLLWNGHYNCYFIRSDQISHSVVSDSLRPHESQHARPPCPSPTPGVHSDSRPSSQWCHPAILSSVVPFSSCSQSLPASQSFAMSQLFA